MQAVLIWLVAILVVTVPIAQVMAFPNPIYFQRSIAYSVFNTTSATVYDTSSPIKAPFEVYLNNQLTYTTTGTVGAVIKLQSAKTGSMNALEIIIFQTKSVDVNWTDKATGTTTKIGGLDGTTLDKIPREIVIENRGSSLNIRTIDGKDIIKGFVLPEDFTIVAISAYGTMSGGATSVASNGFYTVYIGGLDLNKQFSTSLSSIIPLMGTIIGIGALLAVITKLKSRL